MGQSQENIKPIMTFEEVKQAKIQDLIHRLKSNCKKSNELENRTLEKTEITENQKIEIIEIESDEEEVLLDICVDPEPFYCPELGNLIYKTFDFSLPDNVFDPFKLNTTKELNEEPIIDDESEANIDPSSPRDNEEHIYDSELEANIEPLKDEVRPRDNVFELNTLNKNELNEEHIFDEGIDSEPLVDEVGRGGSLNLLLEAVDFLNQLNAVEPELEVRIKYITFKALKWIFSLESLRSCMNLIVNFLDIPQLFNPITLPQIFPIIPSKLCMNFPKFQDQNISTSSRIEEVFMGSKPKIDSLRKIRNRFSDIVMPSTRILRSHQKRFMKRMICDNIFNIEIGSAHNLLIAYIMEYGSNVRITRNKLKMKNRKTI